MPKKSVAPWPRRDGRPGSDRPCRPWWPPTVAPTPHLPMVAINPLPVVLMPNPPLSAFVQSRASCSSGRQRRISMLQPARRKYRKEQKARNTGIATRGIHGGSVISV